MWYKKYSKQTNTTLDMFPYKPHDVYPDSRVSLFNCWLHRRFCEKFCQNKYKKHTTNGHTQCQACVLKHVLNVNIV